ncbi:hypothetical protein like AT3G09110 [Hibiscus trionum]|uniref:Uncharacterized protein n=1 Tax=Hibiscus trionum TaxID=183268 RepID=A0A9W7I172_HIBTR|nr:hypothetical protein like AT3G09110 [Hibiscus trionum]
MAAATTTSTVRLKLLIDRKRKRVVCAEAGKDFVDFLFNILLLPVATVTRLLTKEAMVGCIGNLYQSVENLGNAYIQPTTDKESLLKPKPSPSSAANVPLLPRNIQSSTTQTFYRCREGYSSGCLSYVTNDSTYRCPSCFRTMNSFTTLVNPRKMVPAAPSPAATEGGYVIGAVTYTIMDDLTVMLSSTISSIAMLRKFNVTQFDALEEKVVDVGRSVGLEFLKASLQSKTVLTDVFLSRETRDSHASRKQAVKLEVEEIQSSDDDFKTTSAGGSKKRRAN